MQYPMSQLPGAYQARANALPFAVSRSQTVIPGGSSPGMSASYGAELSAFVSHVGQPLRTNSDPMVSQLAAYQAIAQGRNAEMEQIQTLRLGSARRSGTFLREVRRVPRNVSPAGLEDINAEGFGTSAGSLGAIVAYPSMLGAAAATSDKPWYENPLYLGAGAAAVLGAVWFLTRRRK